MPQDFSSKPTTNVVLALSSEVGVGAVGLSLARFVFASKSVNAICLPTVLFASRPDLGEAGRVDIAASGLEAQLLALESDGWMRRMDGMMTGYFATKAQVEVTAAFITKLKQVRPSALILIDPIIGDFGSGLYVEEVVAEAVRDLLLPLADVITPNLYEFLWLTEAKGEACDHDIAELSLLRNKLPVRSVIVTSANVRDQQIITALFEEDPVLFSSPYYTDVPKGTGDVFAAYLLSLLVKGEPCADAARKTVSLLALVAEKAKGCETISPSLLF